MTREPPGSHQVIVVEKGEPRTAGDGERVVSRAPSTSLLRAAMHPHARIREGQRGDGVRVVGCVVDDHHLEADLLSKGTGDRLLQEVGAVAGGHDHRYLGRRRVTRWWRPSRYTITGKPSRRGEDRPGPRARANGPARPQQILRPAVSDGRSRVHAGRDAAAAERRGGSGEVQLGRRPGLHEASIGAQDAEVPTGGTRYSQRRSLIGAFGNGASATTAAGRRARTAHAAQCTSARTACRMAGPRRPLARGTGRSTGRPRRCAAAARQRRARDARPGPTRSRRCDRPAGPGCRRPSRHPPHRRLPARD